MAQPTESTDDEIGLILDDPDGRKWIEDHLTELRQDAYGQRILYMVLVSIFVIGLIAYVVGYLLKPGAQVDPLGLLADLLYTLGFALWTAAVVVVLVEIVPEAKRRQIKRALEAYEATRRDATARKGDDDVGRSGGDVR